MNKQQAAEHLGVSIRAVERYTQQGRLSATYEAGRTRPVAVYRPDEIDRLRSEIAANLYHQRPSVEKVNTANPEQPDDVGDIQGSQALQRATNQESMTMFVAMISDAIRAQASPANGASAVSVADKLSLSIEDAAGLSGLSANHIREAIKAGKLKARIVGRGWKIAPDVLKTYVAKMLK
jgi:excisionase family DNA binding protein